MVRGYPMFLEYEWLHPIYFRCGHYEHKQNKCVGGKSVMEEDNAQKSGGVGRSTPSYENVNAGDYEVIRMS